jgi:hypothetical protein
VGFDLIQAVPVNNCVFCTVTPRKGYSNPFTGLDRPRGFQEFEAVRISTQSAHEGGKVVSPTHRPPFTLQEMTLVLISISA